MNVCTKNKNRRRETDKFKNPKFLKARPFPYREIALAFWSYWFFMFLLLICKSVTTISVPFILLRWSVQSCLFPRRTCRLLQNKFQEQRLYSDDLPLLLWPTSFPGSLFFRDPVSRWREEGRPWARGCVVTFTLKNILFKNETVFFLRGQQNIKPKLMTEKKKHSYVGV